MLKMSKRDSYGSEMEAKMSLFSQLEVEPTHEPLADGAVLMRGLALPQEREFLAAIDQVTQAAPFRQMVTGGGQVMSIMGTDCGNVRRMDDQYTPVRKYMWPPMPQVLREFSIRCAVRAGFPNFRPDACHFNRYQAGNKLGLHQDRGEVDFTQPIVSLSFGLECVFLFGGMQRTDKPRHILLEHGDVLVWGGPSRLAFHGVQPLKPGCHPLIGPYRINLTFRKMS
jgi:alkylated DNA repair protein (DNA oxidative demethylase)